ncbi:hypothetical protein SAMN05444413_12212 [Roseivivax marinus]|nr:hypothetical protein [Roseivivax marinus]SEL91735.1 hypothetical protein SAMN05444413_12212 [Roseivivax marinus]
MILADTSVWIDHLRQGDAELARGLEAGQIACWTISLPYRSPPWPRFAP